MAGLGLGWRGVDGLRLECKQCTYINTERAFAHEIRRTKPLARFLVSLVRWGI
jgi:hypothetical protein